MPSTINATTSGVVTTGDSVATLSLQTGGTTAVAIDSAQIVTLSKSLALLGSASGSVALAAPATAGTQSYTLPTAQPTADGLALTSTKVGAMSWAAASAAPAGSDTQVQYNNKSSFGGSSSFTFDSGTGIVSATGFSGALNGTVGATTPAAGTFTTATARAAATQDSVVLQGRAGGTSSYAATITPTTLTASRTVTLPDANINFATGLPVANGGTGLTTGTSGGVPYFSGASAISSSAALTQYGIVYGGGAGAAPVATAAGTTGQFLGANTGGAPTWQTPAGTSQWTTSGSNIYYTTGNVGVGTTSPNSKIEAYTTSSGAQALLTLQQADNTGGNSWGIDFRRTAGAGANVVRASIYAVREGNDANGLGFSYTNSSGTLRQGATLNSSGTFNVGVSDIGNLSVTSSAAVYDLLNIIDSTATYGGYYAAFRNSSNALAGNITHATATTVTFNTSSDSRLKEDLGIATETDVIDNIVIHNFKWKQDGNIDRGVFAQEAYQIKPSAVSVGNDKLTEDGNLENPWGVDYSKFVPDLIVYAQQLKKTIQELTARIAALEAK